MAAAIIARVILSLTYHPWWTGDSGGYAAPAFNIFHGIAYDGARTPLYPIILGILELIAQQAIEAKLNAHTAFVVVLAQNLAGIASAGLLFLALDKLAGRWLALSFGLFYAVLFPVIEFDFMILTESLTAAANIAAAFFFVSLLSTPPEKAPSATWLWLLGCSLAATCLLRPNGIITAIVVLIACFIHFRTHRIGYRPFFKMTAITLLPIFLWCSVNYKMTTHFALTTMTGMASCLAVYNLFDKVPEQDRVIGDIMQKYYVKTNQNGETDKVYIWQALPEIREAGKLFPLYTGLPRGDIDVNAYLDVVSKHLARANPRQYLANALDSAKHSFDFEYNAAPAVAGDPATTDGKPVLKSARLESFIIHIAGWQIVLLKGAYILVCLAPAAIVARLRQSPRDARLRIVAALFSICFLTLTAYCFLAAYWPRYAVPLIGIMLIVAGATCAELKKLLRGNEMLERYKKILQKAGRLDAMPKHTDT